MYLLLFFFLVRMTIQGKLLRNQKDCLRHHLQKLVPVDYQVQNRIVVIIVLFMFTIKNAYQEHSLKVKTI